MSVVEEFKEIVENQQKEKIVPFLKKLNNEDKKRLKPVIKKMYSLNFTYDTLLTEVYKSRKIVDDKSNILTKSAFLCLSYKEYQQTANFYADSMSIVEIEKDILSWYQPSWIDRYLFQVMNFAIEYDKMLEFINKGWLNPSIEFIAEHSVYGLSNTSKQLTVQTKKYIWYLFHYDTNIYVYENWMKYFQEYINKGELERIEVLREALLTSPRGFNQPLTGWFCKLFEFLEPTKEELLVLQNELFISLTSPHSKPITNALKYIKTIYSDKRFDIDGFVAQINIILSWDVKSIINTALTLIDKIIKEYPNYQESLSTYILQALSIQDEKIQTKVIKILQKYKMLQDDEVLENISLYQDILFYSVKELLPLVDEVMEDDSIEVIAPQLMQESNIMPSVRTFDDALFSLIAIFNDNDFKFDTYLELLRVMHKQINKDDIQKLQPLLHQVENHIFYRTRTLEFLGGLKSLMAETMFHHIQFLSTLYEDEELNNWIKQIKIKYREGDREEKWMREYLSKSQYSQSERKQHNKPIFIIFEQILKQRLFLMEQNINLPMLSYPTHSPTWIDGRVLIERVSEYQKLQIDISSYDFQVAINRVVIDTILISEIKNRLHGEFKDILLYLVDDNPLDIDKIQKSDLWFVVIKRKNIRDDIVAFAKKFDMENQHSTLYHNPKWEVDEISCDDRKWDSQKGTYIACKRSIKKLSIEKLVSSPKMSLDTIYHRIASNYETTFHSYSIFPQLLLLFPYRPEILLAEYIPNLFDIANYSDAYKVYFLGASKPSIDTSKMLLTIWNHFEEPAYLYLATTFLYEEKTTRTLSAELWIKATSEGTMNHQLLGETLGKLEHNEYAPLKRFTDLIVANMLNISSLHNRGLEVLLSSMIKQMNDEPLNGLKKLLEIYLEVLSLSKQKPSTEVLDKLMVWGEVKSLGVIRNKIILI